MDKSFYVYVWYKDGEPVYVGKGKGKRAYRNQEVDVEIYQNNLTESEAFNLEKELIAKYGRKDRGQGSLWNLTDGGGIAFSTLYWQGEELRKRHTEGNKKRDANILIQNAKAATEKRSVDWQDSLYIIKDPYNNIFKLKTQQLKKYCAENELDFEQLKHIARTRPVKRKTSKHYGYDVKCLYNKVTGKRLDEKNIINIWMR